MLPGCSWPRSLSLGLSGVGRCRRGGLALGCPGCLTGGEAKAKGVRIDRTECKPVGAGNVGCLCGQNTSAVMAPPSLADINFCCKASR